MNSRFLLLLLCFFYLFMATAYSQEQRGPELFSINDSTAPKPMFGFKVGANFQTISGSDWVQATRTGFTGGFFAGLHKNKIGVRAEILASTTRYVSKTAIDSEGHIGDFNVVYLDIPLLLELSFVPWLSIQLGPQYSNMVSVTKNTALDADPKVVFKAGSFSAVGGLEVKLPMHINAGARYVYGFSNLNNEAFASSQNWQTSSVQVYIGYSIR